MSTWLDTSAHAVVNGEESMQYEEFVAEVQRRADLPTALKAQQAIQATLQTLAAYISRKERHDAASQLPKGIKTYLQRPLLSPEKRLGPGPGSPVTADEFFWWVSTLEGVPLEVAREHARAVMSVLRDALSQGEFEDIRAELPAPIYNEFYEDKK
jgi:uncharacterized protein (DUF2267 family)